MRVSLRARQTAAVTLLIALAMTVLSVQHLANLARVGLEDSRGIGELLGRMIYQRAREAIAAGGDPSSRSAPIRASARFSSRPPPTAATSPTPPSSTTRVAPSRTAFPPPKDRRSRPARTWPPCSTATRSRRSAPSTPIASSKWSCRCSSATRRSARFASASRPC